MVGRFSCTSFTYIHLFVGSNKADDNNASTQSSPNKDASAQRVPELAIPQSLRQSWDCIDEIVQILKTAFPLLILTLETVVEQIAQRFKASSEEEIYRLICMLLADAMQVIPQPCCGVLYK